MRYINRAFGFTEKADISFSDVNSSDVFYETVQIAVKQAISTVSATTVWRRRHVDPRAGGNHPRPTAQVHADG